MPSSQPIQTVKCKYCGTLEVVKYGSYRGISRYLCKFCGRKFKDDDHAFYMSVPVAYIDCVLNSYYSGLRINDIRDNMQRRYGYYPSATLIHFWIDKYTAKAEQMIKTCHPQVGDTWVADEIKIKASRKMLWLYDIIDDKTDFLLASFITQNRTKVMVKNLMQTASEVAGRLPKTVLVYMPLLSFRTIEKGIGYVSQQVPQESFTAHYRVGILSSNSIYRIIRGLRYLRTLKMAKKFFNGLSIHYNYFAVNEKLGGKTPAEAAQVDYLYHSWEELVEKSAESRISSTYSRYSGAVLRQGSSWKGD